MKRILTFLVCLPFIVFSQQTTKLKSAGKGFTINGSITGFDEGTAVRLTNANDKTELASGKIENGKFRLAGSVDEPVLGSLVVGREPQQFIYVENKNITIAGSKTDMKNLKVTGSVSHNDFMQFQQVFNPIFSSLNATVSGLNTTPRGTDNYNFLMQKYDSLKTVANTEVDKFVATKSKSYISPFLLFVTGEMFDDPMLMETRYNKLDTSIQHSMIGKSLGEFIAYNKVGAIGTAALDFTQPDTSGHPVSLSSFRGKYVLVDFWASWCGPCRAENPNVVSNYNSFKDKNFTVLGVSLDKPDGKPNWIAAIQRDHLTWTHVSDLKFWNNEAAQLYRVQSIPFNMLLDPTGKIIAKNLRGEELHSKLCEILGCN